MPGADGVRFIQQYSEFGLKEKMPLTGFTIIDSQTVSALGKSAIGVISALTRLTPLTIQKARNSPRSFAQNTNMRQICLRITVTLAPRR